ncbi:MAG: hypothetical protein J3K34DRAFT_413228, partial [Monoraphidium minutum]
MSERPVALGCATAVQFKAFLCDHHHNQLIPILDPPSPYIRHPAALQSQRSSPRSPSSHRRPRRSLDRPIRHPQTADCVSESMPNSKYSLFLDNISSTTRSADIRYEMERAGKVLEVVRDPKHRCALVEFDRADDAKYAWDKMDGFKCHGRSWKVDWANDRDFEFFEKKWTEGYSSKRYSRSRSRSPSRGDSRQISDQTPY